MLGYVNLEDIKLFSMINSRELDEMQTQDADINRRHHGEDVKFYHYDYYVVGGSGGLAPATKRLLSEFS